MVPCPNCGELLPASANFCHMCGDRIMPQPEPPKPLPSLQPEPQFPRWLLWTGVAVATIVLAGVGTSLIRQEGTTKPREGQTDTAAPAEPTRPPAVPPTPEQVLASEGTAVIRVGMASCEGCVVTLLPADGSPAQTATVVRGTAEFGIPTRNTLGLSLSVQHPQGFGDESGTNIAVLAPGDAEPGTPVSVVDVADAAVVGVCWSGTLDGVAAIPLVVEAFSDSTETGGLRVWATPAQPVMEVPVPPAGDGTVGAPALAVCGQARAALAD